MEKNISKQTILVVDDAPENIDILTGILAPNYKVKIALGGEKALDIAQSQAPPNLILLDIMMPGMDGYEVIKRLKSDDITEDIPVIFLTAKSDVEDETRGLKLGAVDYITKPISPSIVLARIKNHLDLKLAQKKLEQHNQELLETAALREDVEQIIRHDLKSPLSVIIGNAQLISAIDEISEKQKKFLKSIEAAAFRILNMINRSLDLIKMERGIYQYTPEQVDAIDIIRKIIEGTKNIAPSKNLTTNIFLNGNPVSLKDRFILKGEKLLFYSMISNLIKNAIEASPQEESIEINLISSDKILISIKNKGVVPSDIRNRFFEKYSTSGKKRGTGLGTYSVKLMAEAMNGKIEMNTSEENGTTITLKFPN